MKKWFSNYNNEISYFHWLLMRLWNLCFHHILFLYFSLIWSFLQTWAYDKASLWQHHEDEQQRVVSDGDGGDRPHTYTHVHTCSHAHTLYVSFCLLCLWAFLWPQNISTLHTTCDKSRITLSYEYQLILNCTFTVSSTSSLLFPPCGDTGDVHVCRDK